jgi:hypothetical protein
MLLCYVVILFSKAKHWGNHALSLNQPFPLHLCFVGITFAHNFRCASRPELAVFAFSFILKIEGVAFSGKLVIFHQAA